MFFKMEDLSISSDFTISVCFFLRKDLYSYIQLGMAVFSTTGSISLLPCIEMTTICRQGIDLLSLCHS